MLKPFFIKKKNIDNRLVPVVSAADAGKVLGVTEDGKIGLIEGGGGGSDEIYIPLTVTAAEFLQLTSGSDVVKTLTDEVKEIVDSGDYIKINFILTADITNNPQILIRPVASTDVDRQWATLLQFVLQGETSSGLVLVTRTIDDSDNTVKLSLTQFN